MVKLLHGDCLEQMKTLADNSIDAVVTDPPYGLAFMGKKWDYDVPTVDVWREVLRVIKPGGHVLSFGGTRTYHRMVVNIEDAGFEIRDQLQWIYGSGFPKSHNLKDNWQGWGSALKPANEPIVLARKPLGEKTLAANVLKWGVGAINVDESRIGIDPKDKNLRPNGSSSKGNANAYGKGVGAISWNNTMDVSKGRWPANVLFDEAAAEMLDAQSGNLSKQGSRKLKDCPSDTFAGGSKDSSFYGDTGGASRFFYVAKASKRERNAGCEGMPEKANNSNSNPARMVGSSSKKALVGDEVEGTASQNSGVKPQANHHPTVKPIKLMEYLCRLITPPNGVILDPFMGSGTTGIAAKNLGFDFIGIELNEEYIEIAKRRIGSDPEPKAEE